MKRRGAAKILVFLLCLGIGVAIGLFAAWVLWPRPQEYTTISRLRPIYQEDYVLMVSIVYGRDGDLARARERLAHLKRGDVAQYVAGLAQRAIEADAPYLARRSLARLAHALGARSGAIVAYVATPARSATAPAETPTCTVTPTRTPTPRLQHPTSTPTPTPSSTAALQFRTPVPLRTDTPAAPLRYELVAKATVTSSEKRQAGRILLYVQDAEGKGIAGVRVKISWADGEDQCVTGLHPGADPGFADYVMTAGITYTVSIADGPSDVATGIVASKKGAGKEESPLSWRLTFEKKQEMGR